MSEVIDQRTVEMRFDNQNFEKNVETSLGTIDKLNNKLHSISDSAKSLKFFEEGLKLSKLQNAKDSIDKIGSSFESIFNTAKNIHGIKLIDQAFTGLERTIKSTIDSMMQINQMKSGWDKYTMKTRSVQTIMAATGKSIDEVSVVLDKLNWYSDETSADFADMVSNIGKFTSAGVKLEDAASAMQGVFNWASVSGRGIQEAGRAMYNLSQAVSIGAVKMADWKSIQLANMDTIEFKETVLDTGVALGKLKKEGNKYYSTVGKRQEITTQNFASTLQTGWFDSELLVGVLKRYSEFNDKVYEYMQLHPEKEFETSTQAMEAMRDEAEKAGKEFDELGYKWFLSAQEAKTFEDAVGAIKDAVSTAWMKTFELIFGNYEQARKLWTDLVETIYPVFAGPGENRNEFFSELMVSNYTRLKKAMTAAGLSAEEFDNKLKSIAESTEANKNKYKELIHDYGSLYLAFEAGAVPMQWVSQTFQELQGDGKKVGRTFEEVEQIVKDTWNTTKYGFGEERFKKYRELGYDAVAMQQLVNIYAQKGKITMEDLAAVGIDAGKSYSQAWDEFAEGNEELINSLNQASGRHLFIAGTMNLISTFSKGFVAIREGIEEVFSLSPEAVKEGLKGFYEFTDSLKLSDEGVEKLKNFATAVVSPIKSIGVVAKKFIGGVFGDTFEGMWPKVQTGLKKSFDGIYTFSRRTAKVFKSLEDSTYVNEAVTKVSEWMDNFIADKSAKIENFNKSFSEIFDKTFVGKNIKKAINDWKEIWADVNKNGGNAFDNIVKTWERFKKKFFEKGKNSEVSQPNWIKAGLGSKFGGLKDTIFSVFKDVAGIDIQKIIDGISLFKHRESLFKSFKENWNGMVENFETLIPAFTDAKSAFRNGLKSGKNFFTSLKEGWNEFLLSYAENLTGGIFDRNSDNAITKARDLFVNSSKENVQILIDRLKNTISNILGKDSLMKKISDGVIKRIKPSDMMEKLIEKITNIKKNGRGVPLFRQLKESWNDFRRYPVLDYILEHPFGKEDKTKNAAKGPTPNQLFPGLSTLMPYLQEVKNNLKAFWNWSKPLLKTIAENFAKDLNFSSLSGLLTSLATLNFSKVGKNIGKFFDTLSNKTKNFSIAGEIKATCEGIAEAFTPLKETKSNLKARSVLAIAASIGIIAASLYGVSKIPLEDLKRSGIIVGVIAAAVAGFSVLVSKLNFVSFSDSLSSTGQVVKMVALIIAISIALKNVGKAAQGIAQAVDEISVATEKFSELAATKIKFQEGLRAVQDLIFALGTASFLAGFGPANIFGGTALTILAFAAAVRVLYEAVKDLTAVALVAPDQLDKAIDAIGELMLKLGAAVAVSGLTGGLGLGSIGRALTIFAFVGAIKALQNSVIELATKTNPYQLKAATDAISEMLYFLGNASFWSGLTGGIFGGFGRAASILSIGLTIKMFVNAIESIMDISGNSQRFIEAKNTIYEILGIVTAISALFSVFNLFHAGPSIGQASSMIAFGLAIRLIGSTIESFGKINKDKLKQGGDAVGMIGALIGIFTVVMGLTNKFLNMNIENIGSAAMLIAFGMAINNIANVVTRLGEYDKETLKKGGATAFVIASIVSLFMFVSSKINKTKGIRNSFGMNFAAIAAGVYIIGLALQKLGEIDESVLRKGGRAVSVLAIVLSGCIAVMNIGAKAPAWTNAVNITALAGAVWILADTAKTFGDMEPRQLLKAGLSIAALLIALTAISKLTLKGNEFDGLSNLLNSLGIVALAGSMAILAEVAKSFGDMEWEQLGKIGTAFGVMVAAMVAISRFVSIGSGISFFSALKFVGSIVAILAILGGIYQIPGVDRLLTSGGDLLGKLGEAIGKFIGGIAGGYQEGVAKTMPAVGSALAEFAENSKPFFEMMTQFKDIDPMKTLEGLLNVLNKATWTEIWAKIFQIFPDSNDPKFKTFEAFGSGLQSLSPGLTTFLESFDDKDTTKVLNVANALEKLNKIGTDTNWMMKKPLENNPFANYGLSIKEGANNIKEAIDALNGLPTANDNAQKAIESLNALGAINTGDDIDIGIETPFFKAVLSWKEQSMEDFATDLSKSVGNIETFIGAVNGLTFSYDSSGKLKTTVLAEALTGMANIPVPPTDGIYTWFRNSKDAVTNFATDMSTAIPFISTFISGANLVEDPDMDKIDSIIDIIKSMAEITMPTNDGNVLLKVSQLVSEYETALSQIRSLANKLRTEYADDLDVVERFTNVFSIFSKSNEFDLGKLDELPKKISKLVEDINKELGGSSIDANLATGLKGIADLMTGDYIVTGFSESAIDITTGISKLASIAKDNGDNEIENAKETVNTFSDFVNKLLYLQNVFKVDKFKKNASSAIESLNGMFSQFDNSGANGLKVRQLTSFFNAIEKLYELDFSYESDGMPLLKTNKLAAAFATLSDSIEKFKPDVEYSDLQEYMTWIEGLSGQKETFQKAGETLSAFVVDPDKLKSVTSFIEALKGEFHFAPGDSIFEQDPYGESSWKKTKGYFQNIADDLVEASKILNGENGEVIDFSGFDTVKNKISAFSIALGQLTKTDMGNVKNKLIEFISGINAAINGEDEHEGVLDYGDKLSQFDSLKTIFDTIEGYADRGLKDVIPNILNGISSAVNDFAPTPAGMQRLKETVDEIAKTLSVLYPYWGMYDNGGPDLSIFNGPAKGPKGSVGTGNSVGHNRISGYEKFVEKYKKAEVKEENPVTDLLASVDNLEIDEEKADILNNIATNISDAAKSIVKADPDSFTSFVQSISTSIEQNGEETNNAATAIAESMIEVLKGFEDEFRGIGQMFNQAIGEGMLSVTDAQDSATILAGQIMESLTTAISEMSGEKSATIVQSIANALGSEESKAAISTALNNLFGQETEATGELAVGQEMTTDMSDVTGIGYKFAQQFVADFEEGLNINAERLAEQLRESLQNVTDSVDMSEMSENISDEAEKAYEETKDPVTKLSQSLNEIVPDGAGLANGMIDGIIAVLKARVEEACKEIAEFASKMAAAAKAALGIASPSKVFYEIGSYVVDGFVNAVHDGNGVAQKAMSDLTSFSISDLESVITQIKSARGPIKFRGRMFNTSDLPRLKELLRKLKLAKESAKDLNEETAGGGGSSGGGGGGGSDDKKQEPVAKTEINGVELTPGQMSEILAELHKTGKETVKMFGTEFSEADIKSNELYGKFGQEYWNNMEYYQNNKAKEQQTSVAQEIKKGVKDTIYDFVDGVKDDFNIAKDIITGDKTVDELLSDTAHLSSIWEQGSGYVGLTKSALIELDTQQQSAANSIGMQLADFAQSIQNDSTKPAFDTHGQPSGSTYNLTQNITAPNPVPASKIYRATSNMLAKMHANVEKAKNNSIGIYSV